MAPSWSARFLSSGGGTHSSNNNNSSSSSNSTAARPTTTGFRDKALPPRPPPQASFDPPPTLYGERSWASPPRPPTSGIGTGAGRHHRHARSVSHPLPKFFGRKKSARDLRDGYQDPDLSLDDDLVPVVDEPPPAGPGAAGPALTRATSGKKGGKPDPDDGKVTRRCVCCDSKVLVPRELEKFRCVACLTIVDLKPLAEQREEKERAKAKAKKDDRPPPDVSSGVTIVPLSVERTRAIIDKCLVAYLEARCRPPPAATVPPSRMLSTPPDEPWPSPEKRAAPMSSSSLQPGTVTDTVGRQLTDAPLSSSPPDGPDGDDATAIARFAATLDGTDRDASAYTWPLPPSAPPGALGPGPPPPPPPTGSIARKPVPTRPTRQPPPPPVDIAQRPGPQSLHPPAYSTSPNGLAPTRPPASPRQNTAEIRERQRYERVKTIFKPLEDYMNASFGDYRTLNTAFSTVQPTRPERARSESSIKTPPPEPTEVLEASPMNALSELDAKTLLLGELGENSSWWTGRLDRRHPDKLRRKKVGESTRRLVSSRSPNIHWTELETWYGLVHSAGEDWRAKLEFVRPEEPGFSTAGLEGTANADEIDADLAEAREHAVRALLKITENVLKRPSRLLIEPEHVRFLLLIMANPSLYPPTRKPARTIVGASTLHPSHSTSHTRPAVPSPASPQQMVSPQKLSSRRGPQHTGILKRVFGLLAHSSDACHRYLTGWFACFDQVRFERVVELVASFITYRISRTSGRHRSKSAAHDGGLIPDLSGSAANTSAQLHSALGLSGSVQQRNEEPDGETNWANDWQTRAAARLMSLLFAANNIWQGTRCDPNAAPRVDSGVALTSTPPHQAKARRSGQLLHTSQFYNTLLDYHDLIADFKIWESKRDKFAFCQYPFFLSMGAKIKILEYDAHRQMQIKAREAWFDSVIRQSSLDSYFHLHVRRDCMVDDSLRQISEAVGAGQEELKKGLRVHFTGEEGVDAGGLRKEWFLMLVRDIFDPNHGMFVYDDESNTCYFNPHSFETSDQYYLVGALLGLAIYNSTILDVALPPFAFRKLLASAPASSGPARVMSTTGTKGQMTYTVADLAEFRPSLAAGLQQLLDFDGNVQETYCRDFVAPVERYGTITNVPLISNGEATPVTNANRLEFVDAYIRYLLDTSVARQFEPFKRGFFTVCAGNALSLFRAEEIELLIRGSDEPLDVDSLRAVALYENWRHWQPPHASLPRPADTVPVIQWFWALFAETSPEKQRKLLTFITGSDRIPAVGATSLVLRIVAGGDGWGGGGAAERERFPVARTCFNMLVLWRYESKAALEEKLWRAVEESEGFGLK